MYEELSQGWLLWPCPAPRRIPLRLTRDDGVADAPGTALVLVDRRYHAHGGTLGKKRRHTLQPPRPSAAGACRVPLPKHCTSSHGPHAEDNLSKDKAHHGKVPSPLLGAVQAHHSSLSCTLQNSANPPQGVAGDVEGRTSRACPLTKPLSRLSWTTEEVSTRARVCRDHREPHQIHLSSARRGRL